MLSYMPLNKFMDLFPIWESFIHACIHTHTQVHTLLNCNSISSIPVESGVKPSVTHLIGPFRTRDNKSDLPLPDSG